MLAFQRSQNIGVGGIAKRRLHLDFLNSGEAGHGVEPAAANDSNFRLCAKPPRKDCCSMKQNDDYTGAPVVGPGCPTRSGGAKHRYGLGLCETVPTFGPPDWVRDPILHSHFVATAAIPNTSCSKVSVVASSKLSVITTVSPCTSMTTDPSSVNQERLPVR